MTLTDDSSTVFDVDYLYYANGWLKEVQENSASIAEYIYDEVGNRTRVDLGNGAYSTYDYHSTDPRYFVSEIEHFRPDDQSIGAITYSQRDDSGNPTSVTYPGGTVSYTYDPNNRLASESSSSFGYDWVGNRLNPPANPSPMVYDATDKLVTWPGEHQYTYYPTGSLYQQKDSQGSVQKTFTYTGAELLESVTHAGVNDPSEMEWDGDANRVSFTSSNTDTTWYFVYDTTAGIPAVIEEETPSGSVYYVREPNGALIARIDGASTHYYHFDALGSTRFLTNGSGTVTDTYTYDAWGNTTHTVGSTEQPYQYVGQLGYYTHYQDENLDLLQLGVRFYDPQTGRFTQRDPLGLTAGLNMYVYSGDRPVVLADPTGLYGVANATIGSPILPAPGSQRPTPSCEPCSTSGAGSVALRVLECTATCGALTAAAIAGGCGWLAMAGPMSATIPGIREAVITCIAVVTLAVFPACMYSCIREGAGCVMERGAPDPWPYPNDAPTQPVKGPIVPIPVAPRPPWIPRTF